MMRREIQPALAHLDAALESNCATLIALEATKTAISEGPDEAEAIQAHVKLAIKSVRHAIDELRALQDVETNLLAFGFVLDGDVRGARGDAGGVRDETCRSQPAPRQLSPRRTA
jgi:hypothetical protein